MNSGKHRNPGTRVIHGPGDPKKSRRTVNEPVHRASSILFPDFATLRAVTADVDNPRRLYYGRLGTPTTFSLEDAITAIDGGAGTVLFPSGLAAIAAALAAHLAPGDHLLIVDSVYGPTRTFCDARLSRMGIQCTYYSPVAAVDELASLLGPNTSAIFLESPGSLTFEVQDAPAIVALARQRGILTIIDNSWASPLFFDAFAHGIDISVQSATKFIAGHSDVFLGTVSARTDELLRPVRQFAADWGMSAGPDDCYLVERGLKSLAVRMDRHQESGRRLANWLKARPEVAAVRHPMLPECPGHEFWSRDFRGASGLFAFELKSASERQVARFVDELSLFRLGYSWGGFESLIVPIGHVLTRSVTTCEAGSRTIRIHVGLEDPEDLIADLERAFRTLRVAANPTTV